MSKLGEYFYLEVVEQKKELLIATYMHTYSFKLIFFSFLKKIYALILQIIY